MHEFTLVCLDLDLGYCFGLETVLITKGNYFQKLLLSTVGMFSRGGIIIQHSHGPLWALTQTLFCQVYQIEEVCVGKPIQVRWI